MRMFLLESGLIKEMPVRPSDLQTYTAAKMINCMLDLDTSPLISMANIIA